MILFSNGSFSGKKAIVRKATLEALVAPKLCRKYAHQGSLSIKTLLRTVKLSALFILIACLQVSARTEAQRVSISLKDSPLERLFTEIEHRTNYVFFYDVAALRDTRVTVRVKDATVDEVLAQALQGMPLSYTIHDRTVFIKGEQVNKPISATPNEPGVGPAAISGVVRAEDGKPLAGATVYIRKLNRHGITDTKGEFILKDVPNGEYKVEISYVGYETFTTIITVADHEARVMAAMKVSSNSLDETVIKGYYNTTNRLNTGNVTTVKGEDIRKQPVTDPILALEGQVPGLYIQQTSGVPGAYSTVRIRGQNSIANSTGKLITANDPLYIVDGVPIGSASLTNTFFGGGVVGNATAGGAIGQGLSPFNNLNPSDIESIEVLKDADATAIYGSRGANGVILITTKKGRSGQTRVDMNVYTGQAKVTRRFDLLNTQQYLAMRHEAFANDGKTPGLTDYDINGAWDTTRYTDWQKVLIGNTASFTNAQLGISGGNSNTQFVLGGGYSNQGTVYPGNYSDQKASAHINLTHSSEDQKFHIQFTTNYISDKSNLPSTDLTSKVILAPDAPAIYNAAGNLNWQIKNGTPTWQNPLAYTVQQANARTNNLISNLNAGYFLLHDLELKSSFGYTHTQLNQTNLTPATFYAPPNDNLPTNRTNYYAMTDVQTWIIEPQLNYHKGIGKAAIDVLAGTTFQENVSQSIGHVAFGFASDALIPNPAAATSNNLNGNTYTQYHYNALFGRIGFNWEEKYLLNITGRRDGSSRFGPGKQFGNFGAVGAGWVFSKERFIQNTISFLSFGKLRISYGTTGNDQIQDYQFLSTYTPVTSSYQNITGLNPTQLTNPDFAWERVNKLEGGLELGFLKNRINLTGSYYRNWSDNQLVGYPLPTLTGFSSVQYNLPAVVQNTGVEITLNTVNVRSANFTWSSSANFTIPRNKLVSFLNIQNTPYKSTYTVGESLFIQKSLYQYTGVDPQTGLYTFNDVDKDGKLSSADYVPTQPITQKYYGGILNSFKYNGFQLDIFVQFVKQLGYNYNKYFIYPGFFSGGLSNQPTYVLKRWQKLGDNANIEKFTQGAGAALTAAANARNTSNYSIVDASFIRVKNASLSYQLPRYLLQKIHIQNIRIYVQCQNLFTITKYQGSDPETGGLGLPPLRMIVGGLQVTF